MMVTGTEILYGRLQSAAITMVSKLSQEFLKFLKNCYYLRKILRETQKSLEDITEARVFPGEDLKAQVLTPAILQRLSAILECHPALVVLGQSCQAKAALVNSLLGEAILPSGGSSWRWVRFLYGLSSHIAVTLSSDFEVVEDLQSHDKAWSVVPEEDLKRSEAEEKDMIDHSTILDIEICHPLLKDNVQLLVPPDFDGLHSFKDVLSKGLKKVMPLFLYAVGEKCLSDQNIHELRELKQLFPELPVLFICTSAPSQELTESEQQLHLQKNSCQQEELCYTSYCLYSGDSNKALLGLTQQLARIEF